VLYVDSRFCSFYMMSVYQLSGSLLREMP